jgi:hypothetical protein
MSVGVNSNLSSLSLMLPGLTDESVNNQDAVLNALLPIFSMAISDSSSSGSSGSSKTKKPVPDYLSGIGMSATEHLSMRDDSSNDAFWDYIEQKSSANKGETSESSSSNSNQMSTIIELLKKLLNL